ncbi:hypothetical protein SAMN06269173_1114 [Hymenobacter mucosus]|uniref:Uncharacterized protein n=1 Tax=Hymenobacter mucosus TaxID=1411120 RepID=A0A239A6P7_9BACT|nr:hypothetical protein SAMN06269173_1114 [Hymenobacter mucosus]
MLCMEPLLFFTPGSLALFTNNRLLTQTYYPFAEILAFTKLRIVKFT